ncbi:MAG: DUF3363 domain-containing protein [Maricaulaceae bacterium]|jgi:type IV secretory pathway VirD2 relaxase
MSEFPDDDLRLRLGRARAAGSTRPKTFLSRVVAESRKAGPGTGRSRGVRAKGLAYGFRGGRRVIVKARIVKLGGKGLKAQLAHLAYIKRDGVERDGSPGRLYDAAIEDAEGRGFAERCREDRHQFRFIVSPEDGGELASLRPFVRGLMEQAERDLGTRLDWVAVDHYDTGHPHTHVVLRGVCDDGRDLVIPRAYISHGLRERAGALLTLELGPETELDVWRRRTNEIGQERVTRLDRKLRDLERNQVVRLDGVRADRHLLSGRLQTLEKLALAVREGPAVWRLSSRLESTLNDLARQGDQFAILRRQLNKHGLQRPLDAGVWSSPGDPEGRIIALGVAEPDGFVERAYAIVDGLDGRARYVDLGADGSIGGLRAGDIVAVRAASGEARAADRTIAAVAEASGGVYSEAAHRAHDPRAREAFVRAHVRRLEALRRSGLVERRSDGTWPINSNFVEEVDAFERERAARAPARLELLTRESLDVQTVRNGATWLDHRLAGDGERALDSTGLGGEARRAMAARRAWLAREGLLPDAEPGRRLSSDSLAELNRRSVAELGRRLEGELGRVYRPARDGERIEGIYRRAEFAGVAKVAVIERGKEFSLVPWREALERARGARVSGVLMGDTVSWDFSRKRGLGIT